MNIILSIKRKKKNSSNWSEIFFNEHGGIDLASIMVGIIVIGLIGGVIAATVFAIIPWSQDNAAKQQLDSIKAAQSAYRGLSSTDTSTLPTGYTANSFASSTQLEQANLLKTSTSYCTVPLDSGKSWAGYARSSSGKIWLVTNENSSPVIHTGTLPSDCRFLDTSPYVDPTPKLTTLTYRCDTDTTGALPFVGASAPLVALKGTETWSDGITRTYDGSTANTVSRTLTAGVTYNVTFNGTYTTFNHKVGTATNIAKCLRSVDHWGSETGVTNAASAFATATSLTDVPDYIPTTITNMSSMFNGASTFNDPSISKWDVSKVQNMSSMFGGATIFDQPLDDWDVSNVTTMQTMFSSAKAFNRPLNNWNTGNVKDLSYMFYNADAFNGLISKWNTSKVTDLTATFRGAAKFNQDISGWDTALVQDMSVTFYGAASFNQPLNSWKTGQVIAMPSMFYGASAFKQDLNSWDVSKVTNMSYMFYGTSFNNTVTSWDVSKVTNMSNMFNNNTLFNQNLSGWNTTSLTSGSSFARYNFPTSYLPPKTSL